MDLASVVAALASVGVRVSGSTPNNNIQGDSSRACPTGLAGPEPSGTINDPGQHFHGSRGYLNVVPLVSQPQLAPQYGPVDSATSGDVTITLPWCCANEALRGMRACSEKWKTELLYTACWLCFTTKVLKRHCKSFHPRGKPSLRFQNPAVSQKYSKTNRNIATAKQRAECIAGPA